MKDPKYKPSDCPNWQETILESIADGVFTVDGDWRITYFNRAAEAITGVSREEALGRQCWEVFHSDVCGANCVLKKTIESGEPFVHKAAHIVRQDGQHIPITISTAVLEDEAGELVGGVETFRSMVELESLRKELTGRYTFSDIVSKNNRMLELLNILPQVALSDAGVLIEGESGTGKELVAQAIHSLSPRRDKPLVIVNCAALPDNLLESELFGHKAGAFTDARKDRPGRFMQADGGTLFLDEIGELPLSMQAKLLRFLQEKTFEPVGGDETIKVNVRIIAATNKQLAEEVATGRFREDLYYRIRVVALSIPPLRERREDIPLLVEHFIAHFNRLQGKEIGHMAPPALALLMGHAFPGNVRELQNVVEHAFVLSPGGALMPEHLPVEYRGSYEPKTPDRLPPSGDLKDLESNLLMQALAQNDFDRQATARQLGIHKTTLWRRMKKLGIETPNK